MTSAINVGQFVKLSEGRTATVRFIGHTSFSHGDWVGIAFDEPIGKNDGSVQGQRYFECAPGHGMFVRSNAILAVWEDATPGEEPSTAVKISGFETDSSKGDQDGLVPLSLDDLETARRQQLNQSPTPSTRRPIVHRNGPPARTSVTSSLTSHTSSRPASPVPEFRSDFASTLFTQRAGSRISTFSARDSQSRASTASFATGQESIDSVPTQNLSSLGTLRDAAALSEDGTADSIRSGSTSRLSQNQSRETDASPDLLTRRPSQTSNESNKVATELPKQQMGPPAPKIPDTRRISELEGKLRLMEKRRAEDREKLKALERIQVEKDRFEVVIQKLQAKYQPQQQELASLRRQMQEAQAKNAALEAAQGEHDSILESITLDREMAEESAEALRNELESFKSRTADLDEEVQLLREENAELSKEIGSEERTGQGWMHIEKSNERLKEALVRLRNVTQTREAELRLEVAALQADLKILGTVNEQYDITKEKLLHADMVIDDLKAQLDAMMGAEELVEELTERNQMLSNQVQTLMLTVEDLEKLKELNDEIEQGHIFGEGQLQEELDRRDAAIIDYQQRAVKQQKQLADQERSIAKYRILVASLQDQTEVARATKQLPQIDAEQITAHSRAMANMNDKLSEALSRIRVKTIEAELRNLAVQDVREHLEILHLFLPHDYQPAENSILTYLQLKRIACKAGLLLRHIKEYSRTESDASYVEDIFQASDSMNRLVTMSLLCNMILDCTTSTIGHVYEDYVTILHDLTMVEQDTDQKIEAWKLGQLGLQDLNAGIDGHLIVLRRIAEKFLNSNPNAYAAQLDFQISAIERRLEHATIALSCTKRAFDSTRKGLSGSLLEANRGFTNGLDSLANEFWSSHCIASATLSSVAQLKDTGLTLPLEMQLSFDAAYKSVDEIMQDVQQFGCYICKKVDLVEDGTKICGVLSKDSFGLDSLASLSAKLCKASKQMKQLQESVMSAPSTKVTQPRQPPWTRHVSSVRAVKEESDITVESFNQLKTALQSHLEDLQARGRTVVEQNVKIELLESRMRDAADAAERIQGLETLLEGASQRESAVKDQLAAQTHELELLRERIQNENLDARLAIADARSDVMDVVSRQEVKALQAEIQDLQGAVRMLRRSATTSRYSETQMVWLKPLELPLAYSRSPEAAASAVKQKEISEIFRELLSITGQAKFVSLKSLPRDKLAWRSTGEKSAWLVSKQREEWHKWHERGRGYVNKQI